MIFSGITLSGNVISILISILLYRILFNYYLPFLSKHGFASSKGNTVHNRLFIMFIWMNGIYFSWKGSVFSSPEPKAHRWANSIPVPPSSVRRPPVRQHFQTSYPLKPLGQLNSNFIWRLLRTPERKFVQMVLVTWPRWPPRPYMVKTL